MIVISLSGDPGSGKSRLSESLSKELGITNIVSTGTLFREMAVSRGMTVDELHYASDIENVHTYVDTALKLLYSQHKKNNEACIFDSRMAWHFIPDSFKIHLKVNADIALERIQHKDRLAESNVTLESLIARKEAEIEKYFSIYGVDISDEENYDVVFNTSIMSEEEVLSFILMELKTRGVLHA